MNEDDAYSEVLAFLYRNKSLYEFFTNAMYVANPSPPPAENLLEDIDLIVPALGRFLNVEGLWYLTFRTCKSEGVKLIAEYLKTQFTTSAQFMNKYKPTIPEEEEAHNQRYRTDFQLWLRTKAKWWEQGYAGVAARGIGPWPKPGGEGQ